MSYDADVEARGEMAPGAPSAEPGPSYEFEDERASGDMVRNDGEVLARRTAAPSSPTPQVAQATPTTPPTTQTDAVEAGTPILIYTANVTVAVHHVEERQKELIALAREKRGFMSLQTANQLVLRIPAAHFEEIMQAIDEAGGILARQVRAEDVGQQYRDLRIRISALDTMRQRLEQLLARAENVQHALQVERELERVVTQLEQMKGQLRHLDDQIAYSTITLLFQPVQTPQVDEQFELPFRWLRELGVDRLMRLQ
jgi:hypothetical protein